MSYQDIEDIKQLKARYFRHLDVQDWESWRALLADDARIDIDGTERTADEFLAVASAGLKDGSSVHHGFLPEIELTGPDTATGIWPMEDRLIFADGSTMRGWGHYHETYRRDGGQWRITGLVLTRLRVEHTSSVATR